MKLKFHNPVEQAVPDAMHTIKDAIEHFFYLIVGRDDCSKIFKSETELQRFTMHQDESISTASVNPARQGRKKSIHDVPYKINKEQKKEADMRACSIMCPDHIDFVSSAFFTKTHFKSHDWKQVSVSAEVCHALTALEHRPLSYVLYTCNLRVKATVIVFNF